MSGIRRRTSSGVIVPRWFYRAQSGIMIVSARFSADIPEEMIRPIVRDRHQTGNALETLVLSAPVDDGGDGGPRPVWITAPSRVIDLIRRDAVDLSTLRRVIARVPGDERLAFLADVGFILSKTDGVPQIVLITEEELPIEAFERIPSRRWRKADLRTNNHARIEGSTTMAGKKNGYINNPEQLSEQLREIVRRIHEDEDPDEMNAYKRFIKQNVSVFSRSYFTAYLVKQFVEGNTETRPREGKRSEPREDRKKRGRREEAPVGNVAPEDRQTLFVSVGKNRRVYPKDFVALFAELDGVEGDDIGQIKILDNYSFVEVEQGVAEKIIGAYDGYEFRGRKLTVNYARNKKDDR